MRQSAVMCLTRWASTCSNNSAPRRQRYPQFLIKPIAEKHQLATILPHAFRPTMLVDVRHLYGATSLTDGPGCLSLV
jgi:hypothetical protein